MDFESEPFLSEIKEEGGKKMKDGFLISAYSYNATSVKSIPSISNTIILMCSCCVSCI